jgi:hypothetical protein
MRQERLIKSVRAAITLDEDAMFNAVLTDKGLQEWILNLNKSQLFRGEDSLGVKLEQTGGGYSIVTEILNRGRTFTYNGQGQMKLEGNSPFLLDSGDYYNSYNLKLGDGFFVIDSDPQKKDNNLEDKYGNNLEGLQDENLQMLIDVIRKKFIQEVRLKLTA